MQRSLGKVLAMGSMWICRVALAYLFAYLGFGLYGTSWAMVIDWYVRIVFFLGRWLKGGWKEKSVI